MMTENGDSYTARYTHSSERTPWMAHPSGYGEAPDSALHDAAAVGLSIAILLVILVLSSWLPA